MFASNFSSTTFWSDTARLPIFSRTGWRGRRLFTEGAGLPCIDMENMGFFFNPALVRIEEEDDLNWMTQTQGNSSSSQGQFQGQHLQFPQEKFRASQLSHGQFGASQPSQGQFAASQSSQGQFGSVQPSQGHFRGSVPSQGEIKVSHPSQPIPLSSHDPLEPFERQISSSENPVLPSQGQQTPATVTKKKKNPKTRGYLIDSLHLSFLVSSYHKHFNEYSNKKTNCTQIIPNKVWRDVYIDYQKEFSDSTFQQESLKEKLRDTQKSSISSNEENSEKATLQSKDFLDKIKSTDSHAKRCILKRRRDIVDQMSPSSMSSDTSTVKENSASQRSVGDVEKERPKTKSEILAETAKGISSLATTFAQGEENMDGLIQLKMESERKRARMFGSKDRSMRMNDLFRLRDEGFYTPEEFKREMDEILNTKF